MSCCIGKGGPPKLNLNFGGGKGQSGGFSIKAKFKFGNIGGRGRGGVPKLGGRCCKKPRNICKPKPKPCCKPNGNGASFQFAAKFKTNGGGYS